MWSNVICYAYSTTDRNRFKRWADWTIVGWGASMIGDRPSFSVFDWRIDRRSVILSWVREVLRREWEWRLWEWMHSQTFCPPSSAGQKMVMISETSKPPTSRLVWLLLLQLLLAELIHRNWRRDGVESWDQQVVVSPCWMRYAPVHGALGASTITDVGVGDGDFASATSGVPFAILLIHAKSFLRAALMSNNSIRVWNCGESGWGGWMVSQGWTVSWSHCDYRCRWWWVLLEWGSQKR